MGPNGRATLQRPTNFGPRNQGQVQDSNGNNMQERQITHAPYKTHMLMQPPPYPPPPYPVLTWQANGPTTPKIEEQTRPPIVTSNRRWSEMTTSSSVPEMYRGWKPSRPSKQNRTNKRVEKIKDIRRTWKRL